MTINLADNNPRANYTATSNQTAFSIPFDYFDDGDVSVYVNGTLKTITTHYTLTTTTVTFTAGLTAGDKVGITRDVPLERTTDLTSTYNAVSINSQLDTIVAQIADLDDRVSRSISLNDYEVGVSLDLPATADRLGKTIQFNSSTGALEVGPSGDELTSIASISSEITALDGISSDITSVAGAIANVNSVGSNISSVTSVAGSISNVNAVNTNITDVNSVAGSITDLNDVADSLDQVELVAGSISNVDIVGPAISNVNTVAGDISNINTVAGISANITTVAGITSAISTVNSNAADITSVSNNIDDVNDVANVITKVTTVADNIANVNTVAPAVTYVSTLANNISNINTLAPISADITAAVAIASDIEDAATNAAAAISAKTAAESARDATLSAFDSFDDRYLGAKTADPSVDNDGNALVGGALYYNSTDEVMKVYTGSAWVAAYASLSGALLVDNNLSDLANAASARTNLGLGTAATTAATDYVAVTGDSMTGNLSFGDNDKAIFGAGSDLQIYHDGVHSYIEESYAAGSFFLRGSSMRIQNTGGTLDYIRATDGSDVKVYYNGSQKLATTSTGIDVTGTVTADGLTVQRGSGIAAQFTTTTHGDDVELQLSAENDSGASKSGQIFFDPDTNTIGFKNGGLKTLHTDSSGNVGIGDTAPSEKLNVAGNVMLEGGNQYLYLTNVGTGNSGIYIRGNTASSYLRSHTTGHFTWEVTGSEKMRIDSSGRVGIGTTSPNTPLHVSTAVTTKSVVETTGTSSDALIEFTRGQGSGNTWSVGLDQSNSSALSFAYLSNGSPSLTSHNKMTIDSSGNVGIGTSSPSQKLHIEGAGNQFILLNNSTTSDGFYIKAGAGAASIQTAGGSDVMNFFTSGSERMRIDSSGNLLVGTTDVTLYDETSGGETGFALRSDGRMYNSRDGGTNAIFNRLTSDGDIMQFRKDGTSVGSIGSNGGSRLYIESGDVGLRLLPDQDDIRPCSNAGANRDAAIDLGDSAARFKDLYLSGGVYLGGTGSANKLDDYEEGTWEPTIFAGSTQATLEHQAASHTQGVYTKIGRQVTLHAEVDINNLNGGTGIITVRNLPFTVGNYLNPTGIEASGNVSYWAGWTSSISNIGMYASDASHLFLLYLGSSTGTAPNDVNGTHIGTGEFRFTITYFTS